MKKLVNQLLKKDKDFIIINPKNEVYIGLIGGEPAFSNDWNEAKKLNDQEQMNKIQRGYYMKLDKMEL
jgi:hypothetical protein